MPWNISCEDIISVTFPEFDFRKENKVFKVEGISKGTSNIRKSFYLGQKEMY